MSTKLTASNLLKAISQLDQNINYDYPNQRTKTKFQILSAQRPEGPIKVLRTNAKGKQANVTISSNALWRVANAIQSNEPFQIDRVVGASYNNRSLLEAILALTPEFNLVKVQRIEFRSESHRVKEGHKHLVWQPLAPHKKGVFQWIDHSFCITESTVDNAYEVLALPDQISDQKCPVDLLRRHAQIQFALTEIGSKMNFRTYVAKNDQGIKYGDRTFAELDGVVVDLGEETLLRPHANAVNSGKFIDAIWFNNSIHLPAVIEIEHSTGITSGLNRMSGFKKRLPRFSDTKFIISCADEDRDQFMKKSHEPQFKDLDPSFLPYSGVEELRYLAKKGRLDCFYNDYSAAKKFFDGFLSELN